MWRICVIIRNIPVARGCTCDSDKFWPLVTANNILKSHCPAAHMFAHFAYLIGSPADLRGSLPLWKAFQRLPHHTANLPQSIFLSFKQKSMSVLLINPFFFRTNHFYRLSCYLCQIYRRVKKIRILFSSHWVSKKLLSIQFRFLQSMLHVLLRQPHFVRDQKKCIVGCHWHKDEC